MRKLKPQINRRRIQLALGWLWLLDGALQLQHQMFTSNFATQVIEPAAQGQPRVVNAVMHLMVKVFLLHPAVFNSLIALTQLGLGFLIIWKKSVKIGLLLSVGWGLFVWYVGEGLGGILSSHTLLLMGAPGAALIYALLAIAVMPRGKLENDDPPDAWLAIVWVVLWLGGAVFQLLPGQNTSANVSQMIYGNASGAPGWLSSLDTHVANTIFQFGARPNTLAQMHMSVSQMAGMNMGTAPITQIATRPGYWFILLMATLMAFVGICILLPRVWRRIAVAIGIALSVCFWFLGQNLGGYYTGVMTDPNSGPLFILLGLAILAIPSLDQKIKNSFDKLEKLLT